MAALLLCVACPAICQPAGNERQPLGVFGTIPLYWGEADGMTEVLAGTATPHWARAVLERDHLLQPLATLSAEVLAPLRLLLIAQPRVLSAQENVALDQWVRDGGRLLLFADPLLTAESRYPLGDMRRPQDVVLLSPLLTHWGLELRFDPEQPPMRETREIAGMLLPYQLAGELLAIGGTGGCVVQPPAIIADCTVGRGRAVIVADAAVLDTYHPAAGSEEALQALLARTAGQPNPQGNNSLAPAGSGPIVDKSVHNAP